MNLANAALVTWMCLGKLGSGGVMVMRVLDMSIWGTRVAKMRNKPGCFGWNKRWNSCEVL